MAGLTFATVNEGQLCRGTKVGKIAYDASVHEGEAKLTWKKGGAEEEPESLLVLLQPDTVLDTKGQSPVRTYIQQFKKNEELVEYLQKKSAEDLERLMNLKAKQAKAHQERFKSFAKLPQKQACLLFGGQELKATEWNDKESKFAEKHLRILSGLYGVLRPYDDVRPVRDLPFDAPLRTKKGENVQEFWADSIRRQLDKDVETATQGGNGKLLLVGLVNEAYWRATNHEDMSKNVKTLFVSFEGANEDEVRFGRQRMARWILTKKLCQQEAIREWDDDDWQWDPAKTKRGHLVLNYRGGASSVKKDKKKSKREKDGSRGSSASARSRQRGTGKEKEREKRGKRGSSLSVGSASPPRKRKDGKKAQQSRSPSPVRARGRESERERGSRKPAPKRRDCDSRSRSRGR
jgi:hypothetical protein